MKKNVITAMQNIAESAIIEPAKPTKPENNLTGI